MTRGKQDPRPLEEIGDLDTNNYDKVLLIQLCNHSDIGIEESWFIR